MGYDTCRILWLGVFYHLKYSYYLCGKNGEIARKSNRAMLPPESLLLAVVFKRDLRSLGTLL